MTTTADQHLARNAAERAARRYGSNSGMSGELTHRFPVNYLDPAYLAKFIGIRGPATITINTPEHADDCASSEGEQGDLDWCDCHPPVALLIDLTDTNGQPRTFIAELREVQ